MSVPRIVLGTLLIAAGLLRPFYRGTGEVEQLTLLAAVAAVAIGVIVLLTLRDRLLLFGTLFLLGGLFGLLPWLLGGLPSSIIESEIVTLRWTSTITALTGIVLLVVWYMRRSGASVTPSPSASS